MANGRRFKLATFSRVFSVSLSVILNLYWPSHSHAAGKPRPTGNQPTFPNQPVQRQGSFKLKVLTYNIKGLPLPGMKHGRYARIGKVLAKRRTMGTAPHIVLVQEAFHRRTAELNQEAGYPYVAAGPKPKLGKTNGGLLILSDLPIGAKKVAAFSQCASFDCLSRKGVMRVLAQIPGLAIPLQVLNTHMQAGPRKDTVSRVTETDAVRLSQIDEAKEFFREHARTDFPVLFGGDFNFRYVSPSGQFDEFLLRFPFRHVVGECLFGGYDNVPCSAVDRGVAEPKYYKTVDHQYVAHGYGVRINPVRYELVFDDANMGTVLSDHVGQEIDYNIVWNLAH